MQISFRKFLEAQEDEHFSMQMEVPLPPDVTTLSNLFHQKGFELRPVGGAIRDYLFAHFHGDVRKYDPKDIDLATNAQPNQVIQILESPEAQRFGIKVFPKGVSFGVISAVLNGKEYEIATYREEWYDPEGPGRRPDQVKFSSAAKDAKRRDLTMNALYYDPATKQIIDYNKGQGVEDIKNKVARFVGDPRDRIREDKLRILRLIRFFSRYNPGEIAQHLDQDTLQAIEDFKHLAGVSPERITNEFITGLVKAANPVNYIKNYVSVGRDDISHPYGLLSTVFPGLKVDVGDIDRIGNIKNPKAVIAWLLKSNLSKSKKDSDDTASAKFVANKLRDLKYPSDIFDSVEFLLRLYRFDPQKVFGYLTKRDIYKQEKNDKIKKLKKFTMEQDITDFAKMAGLENELKYFLNYEPQAKAEDFMHLKGPDIRRAMANHETQSYQQQNR